MLHKRRSAFTRGFSDIGAVLLRFWDQLGASDPGLLRLLMATRGTLAVLLTTTAALTAARFGGFSVVECASGITLSMMGPFLMREPTRRQRQRTLVTLLLPAAGATIGTALLHGRGPAGDSCFLALVFLCFLCHPRSPRVIGIGLVAVVITYVGLYLELPPTSLPLQLLSLVLAIPIIAFACFVVLPMRPAATLRRTVAAVQGRTAQVLRSAREVTEDATSGHEGPDAHRAGGGRAAPAAAMALLRRDLVRLNEAAVTADDQLSLLQPQGREAVRAGLIDIELAVARLIEALRTGTPGPRHATRLRLHERRMRRGRRYMLPAGSLEQGTLLGALVELGHANHALGVAAQAIAPAREVAQAPALPPGPYAWRLATRVTLAAGLAMAGGMALSPQRWFWAVMTVYVVFLNARSRGDTIYKGLQRLGGTLLGVASGLLLATLLGGDEALEAVSLLMSVFAMYYFFLVSYTVGIFSVTVLLGLLYGMLGAPLETLLLLRFEETAIGAAAAIFVAAFVFPTRTRDQVMRSGRAVLANLVEAVRSVRQALSGVPGASPMEAMRRVDRQVADLRLALAPLTAGRVLLRRSALERPVPALLDCVHWTRVLAAASYDRTGTAADALVAQAAQIETRLATLAGVETDAAGGAASVPAKAVPPSAVPLSAVPASSGQGDIQEALDRLNAAVATLAERLEIGAREGFAIDA